MFRRVLLILLSLIVLLLLSGFLYELLAERRVHRRYQPPGQLVDVGGRDIHVNCVGAGEPAIVVEAGSGSWSLDWLQAQRLLAENYRVCTYDRAGYGWSDPADSPPGPERITADLHTALDNVGIEEPFVLIGHSLGGLYARVYALAYPEEVEGLVLVESRHEDVSAMLPQRLVEQEQQMRRVYDLAGVLARFGVVRALGPTLLPATGLPDEQADVFWAQATSPRFFRTVQAEINAIDQVEQRVRARTLTVPLVVVRRGVAAEFPGDEDPAGAEEAWRQSQEALLSVSERSALLVASESAHNVHIEQPGALLDAVQALEDLR